MTYCVFDLETTIKCDKLKNKASPHEGKNFIVASAVGINDSNNNFMVASKYNPMRLQEAGSHTNTKYDINLLVGQNIKFDLLYSLYKYSTINDLSFRDWMIKNNVWDTQIVEYILSGQEILFASLDQLSVKYGGTSKDADIKDFWNNGIQTEDIDQDKLISYLKDDIKNTNTVFRGQSQEVYRIITDQPNGPNDANLLNLIKAMNTAVLAYTEMEYNGMAVDMDKLRTKQAKLEGEADSYEKQIVKLISDCYPGIPLEHLNINSNDHLSVLLFGGHLYYKEKDYVGKYKNGRDKYKTVEKSFYCHGFFDAPSDTVTKKSRKDRNILYQVDTFALKELSVLGGILFEHHHSGGSRPNLYPEYRNCQYKLKECEKLSDVTDYDIDSTNDVFKIIEHLQAIRGINKQLNTYFEPLQKLAFYNYNDIGEYFTVHPNINTCATRTGRLSETEPNLQNQSSKGKSEVKECFVSRFGSDGVLIEADYKQIEIIALAVLSQDKQLLRDVRDGVDLHYETGKDVFGWRSPSDMDELTRRRIKGVNFGLIYGGGVPKLSKQAGLDKITVKKLINAFYKRYPGVKKWQEEFYEGIQRKALLVPSEKTKEKRYPVYKSTVTSITGRRYTFKTYDPPSWMDKGISTFSPTEAKNYPVQGFATGDLVPIALGLLYRHKNAKPELRDKMLLVNQVHDSMILDCHRSVLDDACDLIEEVAEQNVKRYFRSKFNIDLSDIPLKIEIKIGPTWAEQEVYN